jgi:hypothetical protein
MPERGFQTETWSDRWIESLEPLQRYLFFYLWTNEHCNQAGLYEITLRNIAHETKLLEADLPSLIESLVPKVLWYRELDLIWVKNFVRRQAKSPKFLIAAAKCLNLVVPRDHPEIIQGFLEYNKQHMVSIPYLYSTDTLSILTRASSASADASSVSSAKAVSEVGDKGKGLGKPIEGGGKLSNEADYSAATASKKMEKAVSPSGAVPLNKQSAANLDLVSLYEDSLGLSPTGRDSDELKEMGKEYTADWIIRAFAETKKNKGRTLRYVCVILEGYRERGGPDADSGRSRFSGAKGRHPAPQSLLEGLKE